MNTSRIATALAALILSAAAAPALDSRLVYVTPTELHGFGDFDDDGDLDVIVLDQASGVYRIGYQNRFSELDWDDARPSGLAGAGALTVGELLVGEDGFAVCGGSANRVHTIVPGSAGTVAEPVPSFPTGLEPISVAALPLEFTPGTTVPHSLAIEGNWSPDPRQNVLRDPASTPNERVDRSSTGNIERGSRVLFASGQPDGYAAMVRGAAMDTLRLRGTTGGGALPVLDELANLPAGSEFLHGEFGGDQHFVIYKPGASEVRTSRSDAAGSLSAPKLFSVGLPITSVSLINREGANRLLILFGDGTAQEFGFDGSSLTLEQTLPIPLGTHANALLGYATDRLVVLTTSRAGSPSDGYLHFGVDRGRWVPGSGGDLPATGAVAATSNLLLYNADPILDESAILVKVLRVPDWTSGVDFNGGAQLTVFAERFQDEPTGLSGATVFSLGNPPASSTHGLPNQVRGDASIDGAGAFAGPALPTVIADPPGGIYDESISIRLVTKDRNATAYYRFAGSSMPAVALPTLSQIQPPAGTLEDFELIFYAELPDGTRSPLYRERYEFAGEPGEVDTDSDGVPDFVETDPDGGMDTDGDGFSDLEELIAGTDPDDPASKPAAGDRQDFQSVYDLAVRPLAVAPDGSLSETFAPLEPGKPAGVVARSIGGSLLGNATTANHGLGNVDDPVALVEAVTAPGGSFVVAATSKRFDVRATAASDDGREVVGLIPIPEIDEATAIHYTYSGGDVTAERAAWIAAAQAAFNTTQRPLLAHELTHLDSLALLAFERFVTRELQRRDPANPDILELSLTGFRDKAEPEFHLNDALLRTLERPGQNSEPAFLLQQVFSRLRADIVRQPTEDIAQLVALSQELARISAALGDTQRGLFPSHFDTLRKITRADDLSTPAIEPFALPGAASNPVASYAAEVSLSQLELDSAAGGIADLLGRVQERTIHSLSLVVVSDTYQEGSPIVLEEVGNRSRYRLFDAGRRPFAFPSQFQFPAGTRIDVTGFTDGSFPAGDGSGIEVLTAQVVSIGIGGGIDTDGDLLGDDYKLEHFGTHPVDAFADHDGDGFSTLQESLEATDPLDPNDFPAVPVEDLGPPEIDLEMGEARTLVSLTFPAAYDHRIAFALEETQDLFGFDESGILPSRAGSILEFTIPHPDPLPRRDFKRVRMFLR